MSDTNNIRSGHSEPGPIFIVSGGTGRTAVQVIQAALAQFNDPEATVVHRTKIRDVRTARKIAREIADRRGIVLHTLVEPKVRGAFLQETERRLVPSVDLLGPVLHVLEDHFKVPPRNQPGLSYELLKEQFDRMDSVDFTLRHDDGEMLSTLAEADVVLVGVSRVAKSVACFYLAYRGIRAANVPIILGLDLPEELTRLDPRRVIGLTMNAYRLQAIRSARIQAMHYGKVNLYVDHDEIVRELRYALDVMNQHKWKYIDVSYLAVEEIALEVLGSIRSDPCTDEEAAKRAARKPRLTSRH